MVLRRGPMRSAQIEDPDCAAPAPHRCFGEFRIEHGKRKERQGQSEHRALDHAMEALPIELGPVARRAATEDGYDTAEPEDGDGKLCDERKGIR